MFSRQIVLKPETKDSIYTDLCNTMTRQKVFKACGNCDDKWVLGEWPDEVSFLAWAVAMGLGTIVSIEEALCEENK